MRIAVPAATFAGFLLASSAFGAPPVSAVAAADDAAAPAPVSAHPHVVQALELARVWLEGSGPTSRIPGISAAIVYDQQVLWSGGFGQADLASRRPADRGHALQHLLDLEALHERRRAAAARRREAAAGRPGAASTCPGSP